MHFLSALMILVILALAAMTVFFLFWIEEDPPWLLVGVGAGVCLVFVLLNSLVAGMRLRVEEDDAALTVGPWRRRISYRGATLEKELRPVGLTGVRLIAETGVRLYLNPAWFNEFDDAVLKMEERVVAAGGAVREERMGVHT